MAELHQEKSALDNYLGNLKEIGLKPDDRNIKKLSAHAATTLFISSEKSIEYALSACQIMDTLRGIMAPTEPVYWNGVYANPSKRYSIMAITWQDLKWIITEQNPVFSFLGKEGHTATFEEITTSLQAHLLSLLTQEAEEKIKEHYNTYLAAFFDPRRSYSTGEHAPLEHFQINFGHLAPNQQNSPQN